ncbi:MAG: serine hydrolase domain-containing protein [Bacteroidota bacterium]
MTNTCKILLLLAIALHLSCIDSTTHSSNTGGAIVPLISDAYDAPVFLNDSRIEKIKGIADTLQKVFDNHSIEKKIPGIAYGIVVDDTLLIASTTGILNIENTAPVQLNSCFRIASMTKSFTAMAVLKLRDEGLLSLNDPVLEYIPELEKLRYLTSDSPVITIENLLTMTAGFPEDNPWGDRQLALPDEAFTAILADGLSMSKIPAYQYEYSNTGYALLGRIITIVSGISYQEYIKKHLLLPLGMRDTYWEYSNVPEEQLANGYRWEDEKWKAEPILHDGSYGAMGGLITSIEDFSKYVSFHLSAWPARSDPEKGPVKRSTLRAMHTPQFSFLNSWNKDWNGDACASMIGYGYGLGISMDCKRIIRVSHGGALPGFGSNYAFFPEYGIGLMAFGNLTYTRPIPYDKIEKLLFETLNLEARSLPTSDILRQRKDEITALFYKDAFGFEKNIFAENFFLDTSEKKRRSQIQEILDMAGPIIRVQELRPRNQLRGNFKIQCQHGEIDVFFTLTPEKTPRVQRLDVSFEPNTP